MTRDDTASVRYFERPRREYQKVRPARTGCRAVRPGLITSERPIIPSTTRITTSVVGRAMFECAAFVADVSGAGAAT
jgi:hypothetical protein